MTILHRRNFIEKGGIIATSYAIAITVFGTHAALSFPTYRKFVTILVAGSRRKRNQAVKVAGALCAVPPMANPRTTEYLRTRCPVPVNVDDLMTF